MCVTTKMKSIISLLLSVCALIIGCGSTTISMQKEQNEITEFMTKYINACLTYNYEIERSSVKGMLAQSEMFNSEEEYKKTVLSEENQKWLNFLRTAKIQKIDAYEDSAGVVLESPVTYLGIQRHKIILNKFDDDKWYIIEFHSFLDTDWEKYEK